MLLLVREPGYTSVPWNVDTEDWRRKKKGVWVGHGMKQIRRREDSIILMHDIHMSTVKYLDKLISEIKTLKGHRFVTY